MVESRAPGALKFPSDESVPAKRSDFYFIKVILLLVGIIIVNLVIFTSFSIK